MSGQPGNTKIKKYEDQIAQLKEENKKLYTKQMELVSIIKSMDETSLENVNAACRPNSVKELYCDVTGRFWLAAINSFPGSSAKDKFTVLSDVLLIASKVADSAYDECEKIIRRVVRNPFEASVQNQSSNVSKHNTQQTSRAATGVRQQTAVESSATSEYDQRLGSKLNKPKFRELKEKCLKVVQDFLVEIAVKSTTKSRYDQRLGTTLIRAISRELPNTCLDVKQDFLDEHPAVESNTQSGDGQGRGSTLSKAITGEIKQVLNKMKERVFIRSDQSRDDDVKAYVQDRCQLVWIGVGQKSHLTKGASQPLNDQHHGLNPESSLPNQPVTAGERNATSRDDQRLGTTLSRAMSRELRETCLDVNHDFLVEQVLYKMKERDYIPGSDQFGKDFKAYVEKCCQLAWMMVVQQPRMTFSTDGVGKPLDNQLHDLYPESSKPNPPIVSFFKRPVLMHGTTCAIKGQVYLREEVGNLEKGVRL